MPTAAEDHPGTGRVLVTGATGLVGNNVARLLLQRGSRVRVLVREQSDRRALEQLDVQRVTGDVTDAASLAAAMEEVDSVVHAAGCVLIGWKNGDTHDRVNHLGTQNVACAARRAGVRMVHVSTINSLGVGTPSQWADEEHVAGPNIPCPYVSSKQAGEAAVQREVDQGLHAVFVHPALMFGPWDWKPSSGRMILEVARNFTPMAPKGGISVCDVRDVADAILTALAQAPPGRHYVLAGYNLTYLKLWQLIADAAGGSRPWCRSGPAIRWVLGRGGDCWGWITGREPDVNSAAILMSNAYHYFDSSRAQRELNYQIRPVEESLRDAWQWFEQHGFVGPGSSAPNT